MKIKVFLVLAALVFLMGTVSNQSSSHTVPMYKKGKDTYYVKGNLAKLVTSEFMVDTGSGYITINESSLTQLKQAGAATFVKDIVGVLADGSRKIVPIWSISSLLIGNDCVLNNIEAAVFPGRTRQILGLNALKKAAPFTLTFEPPQLILSHCKTVESI